MTWTAVAIAGGAIIGGLLSSDASKSAASTQAGAATQSTQAQLNMFNQQRQDSMPWRNAGAGSVNYLSYLLGIPGYQGFGANGVNYTPGQNYTPAGGTIPGQLGFVNASSLNDWQSRLVPNAMKTFGDTLSTGGFDSVGGPGTGMVPTGSMTPEGWVNKPNPNGTASPAGAAGPMGGMGGFGSLMSRFGMDQFQADPGYAFRMAEGQKALERSAAARGGLLSGAAGKAFMRYGQDMASQEYGNAYNRFNNDQSQQFNRLAALAGIGQTSQGQINNMGMNAANQIGQNYNNMGQAIASGQVGSANAWSNAINGGLNNWLSYRYAYPGASTSGATGTSGIGTGLGSFGGSF